MNDRFVGQRIMQPKKEIMAFLASRGVNVPLIYDTLDEAVRDLEKKEILLRSEHPQDYEGSSDLFPTMSLEYALLNGDNVTEAILSQDIYYVQDSIEKIKTHCFLLGLDYDEFMKDFSHSAWERIKGTNRVMFADSSIPDRYHFINLSDTTYDVVEGSLISTVIDRPIHKPLSEKEARGLIDLYEQIRDLMDSNHCYIVETQTIHDPSSNIYKHFAVQVHRGVDFEEVDFEIEEIDHRKFSFEHIRGATSPEGEDLILTVKYPFSSKHKPSIIEEDASARVSEHDISPVFSEIMFRRRKLQIFPYKFRDSPQGNNLCHELNHHCSINSLSKPCCSVLTYGPGLDSYIDYKILRSDELVQRHVHFVSDGRKAFMKVLD